jgi:hypothetical protein
MTWSEYILTVAAPHSRHNAQHWFRYLRKDIEKDISKEQIEELCNNEALSLFQRVSLKAAFTDGSSTRQYLIDLNCRAEHKILNTVREQHEKNRACK